ncbi:MAG: DUF86 domain-containing protein [Planctomycetes bacterium]|nr:DUF86 domain-containing protein [Planctomycetota bacterium]
MLDERTNDLLDGILDSIEVVAERMKSIKVPDDLVLSPAAVTIPGSIAMRLQHIGETVKNVKSSNPDLFDRHPQVPWKSIVRFRDFISHNYGQINHEIEFNICHDDLPELKSAIESILGQKHQD